MHNHGYLCLSGYFEILIDDKRERGDKVVPGESCLAAESGAHCVQSGWDSEMHTVVLFRNTGVRIVLWETLKHSVFKLKW